MDDIDVTALADILHTENDNALLRFFVWTHLPPHLAAVTRPFSDLALHLVSDGVMPGAQRTVALQKLLEAKDAAVRAAL